MSESCYSEYLKTQMISNILDISLSTKGSSLKENNIRSTVEDFYVTHILNFRLLTITGTYAEVRRQYMVQKIFDRTKRETISRS